MGSDDDNGIICEVLEKEPLKSWLQPGDRIMSDRGFRYTRRRVDQDRGLEFILPSCLRPGQRQFTAEEVRYSKLVSSVRSVQEVSHIRIKSQRLLFNQPYSNKMLSSIREWFHCASHLGHLYFEPLRRDDIDRLVDLSAKETPEEDVRIGAEVGQSRASSALRLPREEEVDLWTANQGLGILFLILSC